MRSDVVWANLFFGALIGALAAAGYRRYLRRPLERIPSLEGIEDAAAAHAYGSVMRLPHMTLLRCPGRRASGRAHATRRSGGHRLRAGLSGHRDGAPSARPMCHRRGSLGYDAGAGDLPRGTGSRPGAPG